MDSNKAKIVDRLGFYGSRRVVSHSIMSEARIIEQEDVAKPSSKKSSYDSSPFDAWEILRDKRSSDKEPTFDDICLTTASKDSADDEEFFDALDDECPLPEKSVAPQKLGVPVVSAPEAAVETFGNAKAISSVQFFRNGEEIEFETRSNLSRFEGRKGMGSAEVFGDHENATSARNSSYFSSYSEHIPEMADIKDSVKQGVSKVADKISNLGSYLSVSALASSFTKLTNWLSSGPCPSKRHR